MLNFLPHPIRGLIASVLLGLNVLVWVSLLFFFSLLKFLLPRQPLRRVFDRILTGIAENWISCNSGWMHLTQKTRWDVQGGDDLNYNRWYLVIGNHQSWADIFVMQHLLNRRIRLLKFFLKRQLLWVPVMGLAWWALDFPFLRRHNAAYLRKHPRQKGKDLLTARQACEKFARYPASVMNFLEGTRFSGAKHARQQSPYQYLLRPKSGGLALAVNVLGEKFPSLLNITMVYPDGIPTFWEFLCGRVTRVLVRLQTREIPGEFLQGDYAGDPVFREAFHQWVQQLWREKDQMMQSLIKEAGAQQTTVPATASPWTTRLNRSTDRMARSGSKSKPGDWRPDHFGISGGPYEEDKNTRGAGRPGADHRGAAGAGSGSRHGTRGGCGSDPTGQRRHPPATALP